MAHSPKYKAVLRNTGKNPRITTFSPDTERHFHVQRTHARICIPTRACVLVHDKNIFRKLWLLRRTNDYSLDLLMCYDVSCAK